MLDHRRLSIYLNDHLAGSTTGLELARRTLSENHGTRYDEVLQWLVREIGEDRQSLLEVMQRLGVRPDPVKQAIGWSLEKVGRLKLNGSLRGYSPLSRLVELEGLWTGVEGKRSLWRALLSLPDDPCLDKAKLAELESRARAQLDQIDEHRNTAAAEAFAV